MARKKTTRHIQELPKEATILHAAWSVKSAMLPEAMEFIEHALRNEKKWIDGQGLQEFEQRNKLSRAENERMRALTTKLNELADMDDPDLEDEHADTIKELQTLLKNRRDVLRDEFHIRTSRFHGAELLLSYLKMKHQPINADRLEIPFTTPN